MVPLLGQRIQSIRTQSIRIQRRGRAAGQRQGEQGRARGVGEKKRRGREKRRSGKDIIVRGGKDTGPKQRLRGSDGSRGSRSL